MRVNSQEMNKVFVINGHGGISPGKLNATFVDLAIKHLQTKGYEVKTTDVKEDWDVDAEIEKHIWADCVLLQTPCNWMGVPWRLKKYMDEIYTAGMDGRLCVGDGRTDKTKDHAKYGLGGSLTNTKYMLSLSFNAPREAFNNMAAGFFEGRSVDDLWLPMHLNFKFFGLKPMPTFSAHDVMKRGADVFEEEVKGFSSHLAEHFPGATRDVA